MIHRNQWIRIVFTSALAISFRVSGQTPAELASRQTMLDAAQKAKAAHDHQRALSLASRAGDIQMTPSLRLFIAEEQSVVGEFADSMSNAELCAEEASDDKTLKNREKIIRACRSLINKLQKSVARILVVMPDPPPAYAQVMINGRVLPESLYGKFYFLAPGNARVEASAPGYLPFKYEVVVGTGEEETVNVAMSRDLPPLPPPAVPAPEVVSTAPEEKSSFREVGPYVALGTGVASLGASAIFLILRNSTVNDLKAQCGGPNHTTCPDTPEVRSLKDKASSYNTWTNVTLGIGAAALLGGGTWLLLEKTHPSTKSTQATLQFTPTQGGAVLGIAGAL
ncbi:MAG TPA: carboxypeptidase-like regulatory domain-containing protein [Myxococcaceae bacterium]|nr:carboxypeptidase-like regulatory domain-containing protein [Myxococcaceae bacterium]